MEEYAGVDAFIEVLNANGIEHIFFNPGGDICPVQVALLKYRAMAKHAPKLALCLHESVALSAAHGHYMVSGKPQVVMVHSELGTQQMGGALHNAQWGRVPVVLMAGSAPSAQRMTWKEEAYDQGTMVRNCVKWDHLIGPDEDMHEVIQHALDVAVAEPRGPVYLSYTRDAFAKKTGRRPPGSYKMPVPVLPMANRESIGRMADSLLAAENPVIVPGYTGRYPETVSSLTELAETLGASVVPGLTRMNFPTIHPLCAGMEEMGGAARPNVPFTEADVVLAIDYDMPYVPAEGMPRPEATILQIDVDPMTQGRPLWGRGANVFVKADSRETIPALTRAIKEKVTEAKETELKTRAQKLKVKLEQQRNERHAMAAAKSKERPISPDWLCYCINQVLEDETVLVNHLISQASSAAAQIDRSNPATLLACAGGSIMWALGAAFGAKVAMPDKMVISLMTDGGFVWGCPVASLWSANSFNAPFMSVIFDNQSYGAIRRIIESMSESRLSDEMGCFTGVDIAPPPDYAMVAQSCGGYGRRVDDPEDVMSALVEASGVVKAGRPAVIDVRLAKG